MQNYNEEYFYLITTGENVPSLGYADDEEESDMELFKENELDASSARHLRYAKPIPRNPKLGDFLEVEAQNAVISERLKNILESFNPKNVQFIPAIIHDKKGIEHEGYYIVHVYNLIKCLDKEKSDWEPSENKPGRAFSVDKLVLDNELIDKIPLEERLVFAPWEHKLTVVYHRSVVDKLLEADPKGMTIYRLSKWDPSAPFKEEYFSKLFGDSNGGE